MHFCVSDHVSEWLSQIVLDKVHLRWEIEESQPPGEIRRAENRTPSAAEIGRDDGGEALGLCRVESVRPARFVLRTRPLPSR